jgi:RNA polymerase sigma factor (sigma-70 family)
MVELEDYFHVVDAVCWRYGTNHMDWFEDLKSEGMLALWEANLDWNQEDNGNFEAYARTRIRNKVLDFIRKLEVRQIVTPVNNIESYIHMNTPERQLLEKERASAIDSKLSKVEQTLNKREKYVLDYHILGDATIRNVSKKFKCGVASVMRDKERILERLKLHVKDDES